jgi:hypothetical protein
LRALRIQQGEPKFHAEDSARPVRQESGALWITSSKP